MFSTSTTTNLDFPKQVVILLTNVVEEATKQAYRMYWNVLMEFLKLHWLGFILTLFVFFVFVTVKAKLLGRWGSFGSFVYNCLYFGALFIIGLIWGPEIFTGNLFNAFCAAILYPVCYIITGRILDKTGIKRF